MKVLLFTVLVQSAIGQQLAGNSISDFVGQLTSLISQNGGLGNLGSGLLQSGGNFPRPDYPPPYETYAQYPPVQQQYPPPPASPGFLAALSSIARYDDLKCVPRLLCEVTSGGKPGYTASQPSSSPVTNKETLITLLTVLNFVDESPLLIFGRAALLGYTARGDSKACLTAYPLCPRDPNALVDYLNNHHGGFFRFFSGQPQPGHNPYNQYGGYPGQYQNYDQNRPGPSQYHPYPFDRYPQGVYRPKPTPPGYSPYDYATNFKTARDYAQERIQNKPYPITSLPQYQRPTSNQKLTFPTRSSKQFKFPTGDSVNSSPNSPYDPFFPDRTGTGHLLLDHQGIHYDYPNNLVNFRDQRSIKFKFPSDMQFPQN